MPKKKKEDTLDLEASFFGDDDLDWLDDDEEEADPEPEPLPVAPPPPPPYVPPPDAVPSSGPQPAGPTMLPPEELDESVAALQDDVPTEPEPDATPVVVEVAVDDDEDEGPITAELPTESVPRPAETLEIIKERDLPTLEVDPTSEEVQVQLDFPAEASGADTAPDEVDEGLEEYEEAYAVTGDQFDHEEQVPLVHTHDPPPLRQSTEDGVAEVSFTPPLEARQRLRYEPQGDQEAWTEAANTLVSEAAAASERAAYLAEAGLVHRIRLASANTASGLLSDAWSAGSEDPEVFRSLADLASVRGDWRAYIEASVQLASVVEGREALEAMADAARVARNELNEGAEAARLLEEALAHLPGDYGILSQLRERYTELERSEERSAVLAIMATQVSGRAAADLLWERGRLLQVLSRHREAQEAFEEALALVPGHAPSFLALEESFLNAHDQVSLGQLYEREAQRAGQTDPAWWSLKAARLYRDAEQQGRAEAAFQAAVATGDPQARREQQAWFQRHERYEDLARSISEEARRTAVEAGKAFALYRLGRVREKRLADHEGALDAYPEALRCDAHATPAGQAVERLLSRTGRYDELLAVLEERLEVVDDANLVVSLLQRIAEIAEGSKGDLQRARTAYERIIGEVSPGYLPAVLGLQRVYYRLGDWEALSGLLEQRASLADDPTLKAELLFRAGSLGKAPLPRSVELLGRALEAVPHHAPSLLPYGAALTEEGRWADLARVLRSAADQPGDDAWRVTVYYRTARLFAERVEDVEAARACLEACLDLSPQFPPALALLRDLAGDGGATDELLAQLRADTEAASSPAERAWLLLAAADLAADLPTANAKDDLEAILAAEPGHPGARAVMELHCMRKGDASGLVKLYQWALDGARTDGERAQYGARLSDLLRNRWDAVGAGEALDQVINLADVPVPARALARTAEALQLWSEAVRLLEKLDTPEDRFERARLLLTRLERADDAFVLFKGLIGDPEVGLAASLMTARVALVQGENATAAATWADLASGEWTPGLRQAHALWAASLYQTLDEEDEAVSLYRLALELEPSSHDTFHALRVILTRRKDVEGLTALYAKVRPDDLRGLAFDLDAMGQDSTAAWDDAAAASSAPLAALLHKERAQSRADDWTGVYQTVSRQLEQVISAQRRERLEAKRRWLLAEKLAETDEAWDLYRQLHEESPQDKEVTEALARIAGARGETDVAIGYLRALAEGAEGMGEAVRYQRRIGEAYEAVGRIDDARQSYLDALDHVPDDSRSLEGLKRLAEGEEDWPALVGVLRREAGLVPAEQRLAVLVQISRLTEERIAEPAQAVDAWREVVEADPTHTEALERLLALSESQGEWELFVETGNALVPSREGAEKSTLLRRIGVACADELGRDDAVRYLEQAVSGKAPDGVAASRLEAAYRDRREWAGVVRSLELQAEIATEAATKVDHLSKAAQLELDVRHDRGEASRLYHAVLENEPEHEVALKFQSRYLYDSGRLEAALPLFERLEPLISKGQDLEDFDVRLELSSFFYRFGEMLSLTERPQDAISRFERALELNPTHLPSLRSVGPLYTLAEAWKKAERVYRQLLQLSGGHGDPAQVATTYSQLGLVERALGHGDKAFKRFSKALEIHPNHLEALKGMALVLHDRQDWSNLLAIYNNIIYHATVPTDVVSAYMIKGRILDEEMSRPDKAAQHYERSLAFDANQPVALLRLAEIAMRREEWHEAGGLAQRGLRLTSTPAEQRADLHAIVAAARLSTGDADGAAKAMLEARGACDALKSTLGDEVLQDLEALGATIRSRLPK